MSYTLTQKQIQEVVIDLLAHKPLEKITVREIVQYAGVNRSTFYRYYLDKYDLIEKILEEAWQQLSKDLRMLPVIPVEPVNINDPTRAWLQLFEHFGMYSRLYNSLLNKNQSLWLLDKIQSHLKAVVDERMQIYLRENKGKIHKSSIELELTSEFVVTTLVGTIRWWLGRNGAISARQIATYWLQLIATGYINFLNLEVSMRNL